MHPILVRRSAISILAEPWRRSCSQYPRLCSLNCSLKRPLDMGALFPLY